MSDFGNHVCGFYYTVNRYQRTYLRPVKLDSHTTINPVSFTTQLHQTFETGADALPRLRYTFPLYDGVAVSGYTITYADKTLTGIVKQKDEAKKTYQAAVNRGETAGLLESLPAGVFGVTLGNVPAKTTLLVEITYCGELKHDAGMDGLRYTLPTSIAPRYGAYPGNLLNSIVSATNMRITVDIDMGAKSAIRKVQSPSHPIAVTMGELSTSAETKTSGTAPFSSSQASATLSQGSTQLDGDFILQVVIDDHTKPQAILEVHPTLPNQRAIMTTVVPKFVLPSANPEIIFIADQSGSMSGAKNKALVAAMKVFLKSLPLGVRFNICAFGNAFQFLWNESQAYSEENVDRAIEFVNGFSAHFGGTELLKPIKAAFERHLKDLPLELMVLTDGEIWQENEVFQYVNDQISGGVEARVFTLGIGQDVSHTLVEGLARAGNGVAQFVTQNEDTDQKVIRMLKGALYAHTKDYALEVNYQETDLEDDDFEIVEKVQDCLNIIAVEEKVAEPAKPKSFFNASVDVDQSHTPKDRYAHLPSISTPNLLQAPSSIPPLFPFNRTTLYLLLDEQASEKNVKSVTLRATSANGPLELEIPISGITQATSIHQLAARKAIQELEEGRGWIHSTKEIRDNDNTLVKQKYAGRFDELVEREAVRLGEKFQVASKWTSFVAVQDHASEDDKDQASEEGTAVSPQAAGQMMPAQFSVGPGSSRTGCFRARRTGGFGAGGGHAAMMATPPAMAARGSAPSGVQPRDRMKETIRTASSSSQAFACQMAASPPPQAVVDPAAMAAAQAEMQDAANMPLANEVDSDSDQDMGFGAFSPSFQPQRAATPAYDYDDGEESEEEEESGDDDMGFGLFDGPPLSKKKRARVPRDRETNKLHAIINFQKFSGAWDCSTDPDVLSFLDNITASELKSLQGGLDAATTAYVMVYLEAKFDAKKDVWEMVASKARTWLEQQVGGNEKVKALLEQAKALLKKQDESGDDM